MIQHTTGLQDVELLLEYLPREGQRVVVSLPVTAEVTDFVGRHVKRALHVPPQAVEPDEAGPRRGEIRFRIVDDPKEEAALELAAEILEGAGARHAAFFCRSEDVAADVGDFLTLHGYAAGAPGVELASATARTASKTLKVAIDLSAVPPAGLAGIEPTDRGAERDKMITYGALGVGATKMKIHKAAIRQLFEAHDQVLDAEDIYALGAKLAS